MKAYELLTVALCILMTGLVVACGDGGGQDNGNGGTADPVATAAETPNGDFGALRDQLWDRLDSFGANIGSVPDDVRDQILGECLELREFADPEVVDQVCRAIGQAIDDSDPGLVDLILDQLAELEPS